MRFPWAILLRWFLPSIPEIVTTVRSMRHGQQEQLHEPFSSDIRVRLEKLESTLERQERLIDDLASRLQYVQTRLHVAVGLAILGAILSLTAIGIAVFR